MSWYFFLKWNQISPSQDPPEPIFESSHRESWLGPHLCSWTSRQHRNLVNLKLHPSCSLAVFSSHQLLLDVCGRCESLCRRLWRMMFQKWINLRPIQNFTFLYSEKRKKYIIMNSVSGLYLFLQVQASFSVGNMKLRHCVGLGWGK